MLIMHEVSKGATRRKKNEQNYKMTPPNYYSNKQTFFKVNCV